MKKHRTIVTLYGMKEEMVILINTIYRNLGYSDVESEETENLKPILEDINSTGFSFKDMIDWDSMSNEEIINLEDDFEKFFSNGEYNCNVRMWKRLETSECYLSIQLNGENTFNWEPLVKQNFDLDWFIDNYEETSSGDWSFINCSIFKDNSEVVEDFYMAEEISSLIVMHPIHYGVCRMSMLHNAKENLEIEKSLTAEELEGHSDNCPHRPFLLKKIEGIDFKIAGVEEEMEGIEQLWKDLGVASERDNMIWRDEDKEIDVLAPLWVLELSE